MMGIKVEQERNCKVNFVLIFLVRCDIIFLERDKEMIRFEEIGKGMEQFFKVIENGYF